MSHVCDAGLLVEVRETGRAKWSDYGSKAAEVCSNILPES